MLSRLLNRFLSKNPNVNRPIKRLRGTKLSIDVLEGRVTPSTIIVDPVVGHGNFTSIQSAINAAHSGDKIVVDPGTYHEQLLITKSNLTITTKGPDATIAPTNLTDPVGAIVKVTGAKNVTINDFNIVGDATAQYGIKVDGGASVTISSNSIKNITGSNGAGIVVGKDADNTTGTAVIIDNTVSNYTKAGIVITNTGSNGAVFANTVTGQFDTADDASSIGIQVSTGANAEVEGNEVSGNRSFSGIYSVGIFTDGAGTSTAILANYSHDNDFGIFIESSKSVQVSGNLSSNNANDGIQLLGSSYTLVSDNWSISNGGDGISVYSAGVSGDAVGNVIADNVIADNAGNGVTIGFAGDPNVVGTKVVSNLIFDNDGTGVAVTDASNTTIAFNFIDADDGTTAISVTASTGTQTVANFIVH